ncbi:hypothetical protein KIV45_06950 [Janthinobacterium lividum]|nr:hypothetical protein KIV45_06950 [Janthinobacterium lividum]
MKKLCFALVIMFISSQAIASPISPTNAEQKAAAESLREVTPDALQKSVADIRILLAKFQLAIKEKNRLDFNSLFYHPNIPWIGVMGAESYARIVVKYPSVKKVEEFSALSYTSFFDAIVARPISFEEKFDDVEITTDGEIGSANFKYTFYAGNYKQNWGSESWHLLLTKDGWKISSVIYSATWNPEPPPVQ